ncbi:MAG TPA: aldehyde dehydrogenase family protein [Clostridia bacterium]|nr:aldehyde dehydrogenase family protein [Clostridia bacterium]
MNTPARSPERIVNTNPATGEVLSEHACAAAANVQDAVARARAAQPAWSRLGIAGRVRVLRRFQQLLLEQRSEVAACVTAESGKPVVESLVSEVIVTLDAARFCTENVYRVMREEDVRHANIVMKTKRGRILHEPVGVLGIISPWNYPLSIPATETLAALVTGNAVVLKPSELTPLSALYLARLLHEAGVPQDIFQVVLGFGGTGSALIESGIDKLVFTGSVETGKRVAEAAARRLVPVVLELGGKDPMLVLDDADVDIASSAAVWGALMNAGQTCLSVERCYVHRNLYERFVSECARKIGQLKVGNGANAETDIGPLISLRQLEAVEAQIEEAVAAGAIAVTGGKRLPQLGPNFFAPTLLVNVNHRMSLMQKETFGPVLPIMAFDSDDEAIALANDSDFGLSASIWTRNARRGDALARRVNAGTVMVNDVITCFAVAEAPHGGIKASGLGRTHGLFGMREMVRTKYVASDLLPSIKKVWWYGYGEQLGHQMSAFVGLLFGNSLVARAKGAAISFPSLWRKRL